jgi:hypothetical protein
MAVSHCMQVDGTNSSWPSNWDLTTRILDRSGLHSFMLRSEQATSHIWQPLHLSALMIIT